MKRKEKKTYYVVAHKGQISHFWNFKVYYMLGILFSIYLYTYIYLYSSLLNFVFFQGAKGCNNQVSKSEGRSAGNWKGTSEAIRTLSEQERQWLAGVMDGGGKFDIRNINGKRVLKAIRIVQAPRDARILARVKDLLKLGRIKVKSKNALYYILSDSKSMATFVNAINGEIRLNIPGFKEACNSLGINYIHPNNIVPENSAYLGGLIDTDGSIVFNYPGNRIEVHLELKDNEYSENLDLSKVIPGEHLEVYRYIKRNQNRDKIFYSIRMSYANVGSMRAIYEYVLKNRLYSDFKFFRVMQIKAFLEIRDFKNSPIPENRQVYKNFLIKFAKYLNEHKNLPDYCQ